MVVAHENRVLMDCRRLGCAHARGPTIRKENPSGIPKPVGQLQREAGNSDEIRAQGRIDPAKRVSQVLSAFFRWNEKLQRSAAPIRAHESPDELMNGVDHFFLADWSRNDLKSLERSRSAVGSLFGIFGFGHDEVYCPGAQVDMVGWNIRYRS